MLIILSDKDDDQVQLILQVDLNKLFPQHMWLFPSRAYLASGAGNATAWRALFKALGFTDFIQAPSVALRLTPEQKAASHWAGANLGPLDATGHHTVQDWSADEFRAVVGSLQQHCKGKNALQAHCGHLAHCIDALWGDEFAGCVSAQPGSQVTGKLIVACFDVSSSSFACVPCVEALASAVVSWLRATAAWHSALGSRAAVFLVLIDWLFTCRETSRVLGHALNNPM